jgi:hypothetical protein
MKMEYISSTFLEYQSISSTRVLFSLVHGLDLLSSEIGHFQEYNKQMR